MAYKAIVIKDPQRARDKEVERNVRHNLTAHTSDGRRRRPEEHQRLEQNIRRAVERNAGPMKAAGELHTHMEHDCPEGLPNCRNCGDPQHSHTCRAAGHCPDCGTKHGIAPDRTLEDNGYELVDLPDVPDESDGGDKRRKFFADHEWSRQQKAFKKKTA